MNSFWKFIISAVILLVVGYILYAVIKTFWLGGYVQNASGINVGLILLGCTVLGYVTVKGIIKVWTTLILFLVILQGCNYAKSNQQVLVSDDCGMNWNQINAGDAVPKGGINPCYMKVVIPNFPMQGDASFVSNLAARVRVVVHIDYDYSITNGLAFIKEAKSLGKANTDADDVDAIDPKSFESAENRVIDKRIRDVAKGLLLTQDIIELDQADLEDELLEACNKRLEKLGVQLNFITLTFDTDEQTRQAIDVSTAMKIYESKGLRQVGEQVMVARAGATKVIVENKLPAQVTE